MANRLTTLALWILEARMGWAHSVTMPLDGLLQLMRNLRSRAPPATIAGSDGKTIVVCHGFGPPTHYLHQRGPELATATDAVILFPQTAARGNFDTFEEFLDRNRDFIAALASRSGEIIFVGFSRGGINAAGLAAAVIEAGMESNEVYLITVATPWRGSWMAWFTRSEAGKEMHPGSAALKAQRAKLDALHHRPQHVRCPHDAVVPHGGAHEEAEPVECATGHWSIYSQAMWAHVADMCNGFFSS